MEEASDAVLPMSVIFLLIKSVIGKDGSLNGGFKRPSFEIISF